MSKIIIGTFLFISSCASAQLGAELEGKTFIANTGSVCQETTVPDPCAGYQSYVELSFEKHQVIIREKGISSCDKLVYDHKYTTEWAFENPNKIILKEVKPEYNSGQEIFASNILLFENDSLVVQSGNSDVKGYVFELQSGGKKKQKESKNEIQEVSISIFGGRSTIRSKAYFITKDSVRYSLIAHDATRNVMKSYVNIKQDWESLLKKIDLQAFKNAKNGKTHQLYDGNDTEITITTSDNKFVKMNASDNKIWDSIYRQLVQTYFREE